MSIDMNLYVGPYLRVTVIVTEVRVDQCENHNRPDNAGYCPVCGRSVHNRYLESDDENAPEDWRENYVKNGKKTEFSDYLFDTSSMAEPDIETDESGKQTRTYLYLPNRYRKELGVPDIDGDLGDAEVPLDEVNIGTVMQKFRALFADEIAYLRQWFAVEVRYGLIQWCS